MMKHFCSLLLLLGSSVTVARAQGGGVGNSTTAATQAGNAGYIIQPVAPTPENLLR